MTQAMTQEMTQNMMPGDQARVTVSVAVPPHEAFEVFTQEIDLWRRRGQKYRHLTGERALIAIEPRLHGWGVQMSVYRLLTKRRNQPR
jgi:hypothetical protein